MAITSALLGSRPPSSPFLGDRSRLSLQGVSSIPTSSSSTVRCSARAQEKAISDFARHVACGLCGAAVVLNLWTYGPQAFAAVRLPPLSKEADRCEKAFVGNTIGQANGVADKLLDLRFCDYTNDKTNLKGKTLSAALMADAKFDGADMTEVTMSKAYAVNASFKGADFTNAILDRVIFDGADMQGANFKNAVLSGSTFQDTKLEGSNFEDALIGYVDLQKLCKNTTLSDDARATLGCRS